MPLSGDRGNLWVLLDRLSNNVGSSECVSWKRSVKTVSKIARTSGPLPFLDGRGWAK